MKFVNVTKSNTGRPVTFRIALEKGGRSVHSNTNAPISDCFIIEHAVEITSFSTVEISISSSGGELPKSKELGLLASTRSA